MKTAEIMERFKDPEYRAAFNARLPQEMLAEAAAGPRRDTVLALWQGNLAEDTIRIARALLGMSQAELAARLGYTRSTISMWETGALPMPRVAQLALVALLTYREQDER